MNTKEELHAFPAPPPALIEGPYGAQLQYPSYGMSLRAYIAIRAPLPPLQEFLVSMPDGECDAIIDADVALRLRYADRMLKALNGD